MTNLLFLVRAACDGETAVYETNERKVGDDLRHAVESSSSTERKESKQAKSPLTINKGVRTRQECHATARFRFLSR